MSKLIEDLAYIFEWLEYTKTGISDYYNQGLTRQQIDEIVKVLPFKLSEEVYELYQWRNGFDFNNGSSQDKFLFPEQLRNDVPLPFCSLQDSIYIHNIKTSISQKMQIFTINLGIRSGFLLVHLRLKKYFM
jgi:hypothetical protein